MRKKWKGYLGLAVLTILFGTTSKVSSQTAPVSLKKSIEIAIANNYSLKADSMNMLAARYQKNVIKADNLPQANYSSKSEYNPAIASQMIPGKIAGQPDKDYVPVQFGTAYSMLNGIEVTQNLFRKDTKLKISGAELNTRIVQTKHNLTREELVYNVASSYYDLQATAEKIRTTSKDYDNIMHVVKISRAQVKNGMLKRIDLESLEINAANKKSQLNQYQSSYDVQLANFKYLLGISPDEIISVETGVQDPSLDMTAANSQLYNREDLHLNRQMIESKEIELKSIRAERLPVTSAYFRFNYQSQYNKAGDAFNSDYWTKSSVVGLSTKISLFDGFRRKNRISIAQTELQQLKFQGELQTQLANTEWIVANSKLNNDLEQYKITKHNLELAEKVFASRTALYGEGVSSLIELLDADRELSQARDNHIQSMVNVHTGMLNTHKANGTILTGFLKTL